MVYGMGDGINCNPVVGLDVEGHEFSHMVINNNGNGGLTYQGESGALNESFADIFGTCVEFYASSSPNWTIGENVMINSPFFMRSMSNPNLGFQPQPDTYLGTNWQPTSNSSDNGGVHTNSGVQNYWFYLLCQGGSGTNDLGNSYSVTGIGITQAR
jgi:Zn-dependent metalloprotease